MGGLAGRGPVAGAGVDGVVVAVAVRRAGRCAARGADGAAAAGGPGVRSLVPAGSAAGDCLAVLEAVTAGLRRRFPALAAVTAHEVAAHLTGGLWLAPAVPAVGFNTTLDAVDAVSPW